MQTQADTLYRLLTLTTIFMTQRWEEDEEWSGETEGMNYREWEWNVEVKERNFGNIIRGLKEEQKNGKIWTLDRSSPTHFLLPWYVTLSIKVILLQPSESTGVSEKGADIYFYSPVNNSTFEHDQCKIAASL